MSPGQLSRAASALSAAFLSRGATDEPPRDPNTQPRRLSLGLLIYCFSLAQRARSEVAGVPDYSDPLVFIQEAARIGASAVQIPFPVSDSRRNRQIRDVAEKLGVALESTISLPTSDGGLDRLQADLATLRELGVNVARTVVFPGRRYEDLHSYSAYETALVTARERLRRAEPLAKRYQVRLAVENHKDQRIDERVKLLEEFSSEQIGACIDVGNNIALLEDPVEVARALLPWALTIHFKDQGVREYEDGFLLADVPLGQGVIDLAAVIRTLREKKPGLHFQLELITRDPLKVPILRESYWPTFPGVKAAELSSAWAMVKARGATKPFPTVSNLDTQQKIAVERKNIEESFRFAAEHLEI